MADKKLDKKTEREIELNKLIQDVSISRTHIVSGGNCVISQSNMRKIYEKLNELKVIMKKMDNGEIQKTSGFHFQVGDKDIFL